MILSTKIIWLSITKGIKGFTKDCRFKQLKLSFESFSHYLVRPDLVLVRVDLLVAGVKLVVLEVNLALQVGDFLLVQLLNVLGGVNRLILLFEVELALLFQNGGVLVHLEDLVSPANAT